MQIYTIGSLYGSAEYGATGTVGATGSGFGGGGGGVGTLGSGCGGGWMTPGRFGGGGAERAGIGVFLNSICGSSWSSSNLLLSIGFGVAGGAVPCVASLCPA